MKRRIQFQVARELPPKKDGANSMWAKRAEVPRLIALRRAAFEALAGQPAFRSNISLELEVHCPQMPGRGGGDLDNFVTGVCDGLMAAAIGARSDPRWEVPGLESVHPSKTVAIEDDSAVVSINATKSADVATPWYRVCLQGE